MRRRRYLATLAATAPALSGCATLRTLHETSPPAFQYDVTHPISDIAVGENVLYIAGGSDRNPGAIRALDRHSGDHRWTKPTTASGNTLSLKAIGNTVLVWTSATLSLSGIPSFADQPWTRSNITQFPPPASNDTTYLARPPTIEAVSLQTGTTEWTATPKTPMGNPTTPLPSLETPTIIIAATWDGRIAGLDPHTGSPTWWTQTRNAGPLFEAAPDTIYVGGEYQPAPVHLDRLDPATGTVETSHAFDARHAIPINAPDPLLVQTAGATGHAVHRLNPDTGRRHWTYDNFTSANALTTEETIIGHTPDSPYRITAIDARTGTERWHHQSPDPDANLTIAATDDTVIIVTPSIVMARHRTDGTERYRHAVDAAPIGQPRLTTQQNMAYYTSGTTLYAYPA